MNQILRNTDFDSMTVEERLELIDAIWASLERVPEDAMPVPAWVEAEVARRLKSLDSGEETTVSWEEAKRQILGKQ